MFEGLGVKRAAWLCLATGLALAACGGGDSETSSPSLADYTFYGQGASVIQSPISAEIPSTGVLRMFPDGSQTFDVLTRCVPADSTTASGTSPQQSISVGVLAAKATLLANASALMAVAAGKTFYYAENCTYLSSGGEPLNPPLGPAAISMVVDDKGSRILNGPSNTLSEVDAVLSERGMVVSEGPTIHWFAYQVGSAVVIVNTTNHSTSAVPANNRVGVWIAQ